VDPIGLLGGTNNYEYAPNPVGWIDPLGLSCKEYPLTKQLDNEYEGEHLPGNDVWNWLGGSQVKYLDEIEREKYRIFIQDGKLVKSNGEAFDSMSPNGTSSSGIFVMDPQGKIYAHNDPKIGEFHHSSFLAGKPVAAAGEIDVANGTLLKVNKQSGHYKPDEEHLDQFVTELKNQEVDMSKVRIE
jgi:hypothetical protein